MATVGTVIIDVKADTAKLVSGMDRAEKSVKKSVENIKQSLITMASAYLGFQGASKAYDVVIKSGLAYNMQLEESKAGLVALSVAVQNDTIPIMERYANANKEATATLNELQKINASTPHTLDQTNQIYKSMYVSMKNAGASTKEIIDLTKQVSIAAGAGGIEFNSLLAGVDGLATGTVLANSDLGRFLSSLGLTNKALKESKDVVNLLETKLKSFKAPDTMQVALSNLQTTWDQLAGELTKPLFDTAKQDLKDFTKVLNDNRADLLEFGLDVGRTGQLVANGYKAIYQSSTLGYLKLAYTFKTEIGEILNYVTDTMVETNNYWADTWIGKKAGLEKIKIDDFIIDGNALKKQIDSIGLSLAGLGIENDKLLNDILENTQVQKQSVEEVETSLDKKSKKSQELSDKEKKQAIDLNNAKIKAYSDYINIVGTEEEKFQDKLAQQMSALGESGVLTAEQLKKAFDKLNSGHKLNFFNGWTDTVSKTFADGIQQAIDGNFNFDNMVNSLSKTLSNTMIQTSANNMTTSLSSSGSISNGDIWTMALGVVMSSVTKANDDNILSQNNLAKSIKSLNESTDRLATINIGNGTALANNLSNLNALKSKYISAQEANSNYNNSINGQVSDRITNNSPDLAGNIGKYFGTDIFTDPVTKYLDDSMANWLGLGKKKSNDNQTAINEARTAINNWTIAMVKSADSLSSYASKFGDMYDKLTSSSYFSDKRGKVAYDKVTGTFGMSLLDLTKTLADKFNITDIKQFKQDLASDKTTKEFNNAMTTATQLMDEFGVKAVDSFDDISTAVDYLANNTSKATSEISKISDVIKTISNVTNGLNQNSMDKFNGDMSALMALRNNPLSDGFSSALDTAISSSSALMDSSNFTSANNQNYAKAVAINEFGTLKGSVVTQLDVLKQIATNTSNTDENTKNSDSNSDNEIASAENNAQSYTYALFDVSKALQDPMYAAVAGLELFSKLFTDSWKWLENYFAHGINILGLDKPFQMLGDSFKTLSGSIGWTMSILNNTVTSSLNIINSGFGKLSSGFNNLSNGFTNSFSWLSNSFKSLNGSIGWMSSILNGSINRLGGVFSNSFSWLSNSFSKGLKVIGINDALSSIGNAIQKLANALNVSDSIGDALGNLNPLSGGSGISDPFGVLPSVSVPSFRGFGWETGGYTGNIPANNIAGLVHGQEYVINAPTTRDLGLNNGQGGVFKEILEQNKKLVNEIKILNNEITNIKSNTEREYA